MGIFDWAQGWMGGNASSSSPDEQTSKQRAKSKSNDTCAAREQPTTSSTTRNDEATRERRIETQKQMEVDALKRGHFAKRQRVRYHHRSTDTYYDAVVTGVHFDDGPDKPYYSIKYKRPEVQHDDDGNESTTITLRETQTTPDRLLSLPWDEGKAWEAMNL